MAGGTFIAQNKVRPGAYINFIAKPKSLMNIGERGIVTIPIAMTWGPEKTVVKVYNTDLLDGKSLPKIGVVATDAASLIYRLALADCHTGLFYRVDVGGDEATVTIGKLICTAKYPGTTGNSLEVVIAENGDDFDVITLFNGIQKDLQTVSDATELENNDWINFTYTTDGALVANAGSPLVDGTNGTVSSATYTDYFAEMKKHFWTTMGIPSSDNTLPPLALAYIKDLRDSQGIKVQCAVYDYNEADYEGIISSDQGYKTESETISAVNFVAAVAGMTAGSAPNKSNTGRVLAGATEIINLKDNQTIIDGLKAGQFILSMRRDGKVKVEQDINTLTTLTAEKSYAFKKNRVIRCLDDIGNQVAATWETSYMGKVDNDDNGRNVFKSDLINYGTRLQSIKCIQNFDSQNDISVEAGEEIDATVVDWDVQPVDSMEKLYMTVIVR